MKKETLEEFNRFYQDEAELPTLDERLSSYRIVSCLYHSPEKQNYLLKHKETGKKVFLKCAAGRYASMLKTESMCHTFGKFPFFPYVFEYFESDDKAFLLREYIEGETLEEIIEKNGPLSLEKAIPIVSQICSFLSQLHKNMPPIIYRDLKPSNVVITAHGDCYLIDTGTLRIYREDANTDTVFIGTAKTAAPEQFGARQTDQRTNIYSLGILFFYLLTGKLQIQKNDLRQLPKRTSAIISRCTSFDPERRYPDVEEVLRDIHALLPDKRLLISRLTAAASLCALIAVLSAVCIPHLHLPNKKVTFSSPLLEQAVREELGIDAAAPVYEKDLEKITQILICGNVVFHDMDTHRQYLDEHDINGEVPQDGDISDISILSQMPNLRYVVLDCQEITDISPLKSLSLISLSLRENPLTDLSPLSGCNTLQELSVCYTNVSSLDALSDCINLRWLDISSTPVVSLAPLCGLPIHNLLIPDISSIDYESLGQLPLTYLVCRYYTLDKLDYLAQIPTLQSLTIYNSGITSLSDLKGLEHLITVDVCSNNITDLDGIEVFHSMHCLAISDNPLTDFSALPNMHGLSNIDMVVDGDVDYSFLNDMPWVQSISIKTTQLDSLYKAVPSPWFEINFFE